MKTKRHFSADAVLLLSVILTFKGHIADELNLTMDNLALFKSVMLNYYFSSLKTTFDYENLRTFKQYA